MLTKKSAFVAAVATLLNNVLLVKGDICFMVFQMADNNLEQFIRNDQAELINSDLIEDPTFNTWIYFDGRNLEGTDEDITIPLPNVYDASGNLLTQKYEGSRYLHYNHAQGRMEVDTTLPGEQDGDDPNTIFNFVTHALTDCVTNGSDEYFLVFSSHGGGFAGFGGDENWERRQLQLQPNTDIVGALQNALSSVPGGPPVFDMIGFDACLMQAFGALDEFRSVATYFLASTATEPGHGWAYTELTNANSVLELATEIVDTFVESPQNHWSVQYQPKTLSVVESSKFSIFLDAWEGLMGEFARILEAADDADFYTYLQRARASSVSFEGYGDDTGTTTPSALDIGSFMSTFESICNPNSNTQIPTLLDAAQAAYDDMFFARRIGQGTPACTGMHIMFPMIPEFEAYRNYWSTRLFNERNYHTTMDAPNWRSFLRLYYDSETPSTTNAYVCGITAQSTIEPEFENQLLLNPSVDVGTERIVVRSEITRTVDEVIVEFGIDFTDGMQQIFAAGGGRRHLQNWKMDDEERQYREKMGLPLPEGMSSTPTYQHAGNRRVAARAQHQQERQQQRQLQEQDTSNDYLLYYGGSIISSYTGSQFEAVWDRRFWGIMDDNEKYEELYVIDHGNGARRVPVLYYPPYINPDNLDLPVLTLQDGKNLGGVYSYLTFSVDEATGNIRNNLALYTTDNATSTSEMPRSNGGSIAPIIYVEAEFQGYPVDVLIGGAFGNVFAWNEQSNLTIHAGNVQFILEEYGLDNYILDVTAFDHDTNTEDYYQFRLDSDSDLVSPVNFDYDGDPTTIGQGGPVDPGQLAADLGIIDEAPGAGSSGYSTTILFTSLVGIIVASLLLFRN